MLEISNDIKNKIIDFIINEELDYQINNNGLIRFHLQSDDNYKFFIYEYQNSYVVAKNDPIEIKKYEYYNFKSLSQLLEQLKIYDSSLPKNYWIPVLESIDDNFNKNTYDEKWYVDFLNDSNFKVETNENYSFLIYENENIKPNISSPFNTLHDVCSLYKKTYNKIDKLYFEIYPISLENRYEKYYLKLKNNNDEIFKEFINFEIYKKKGLKLFLKELSNSI